MTTQIDPVTELVSMFGLLKGTCVSFQKIAAYQPSEVRVGTKVDGILHENIQLNHEVTFLDSKAVLSPIQKMWIEKGVLLFQTTTSLYRNLPLRISREGESFDWSQLHHVVTEKGSIYRYLVNGKTQRFKTLENCLSPTKDLLVFIPQSDHSGQVVDYVHGDGTCVRVVNGLGNQMKSNEEIRRNGRIYLTLGRGETVDFNLPASHLPQIGYSAFDKTFNPDGTARLHLGHKVTKIVLKQ